MQNVRCGPVQHRLQRGMNLIHVVSFSQIAGRLFIQIGQADDYCAINLRDEAKMMIGDAPASDDSNAEESLLICIDREC